VIAGKLGTEAVVFPSHHGGFVSSESGWGGKPAEFAAKLREVLDREEANLGQPAGASTRS
jgi:hypothetical protein